MPKMGSSVGSLPSLARMESQVVLTPHAIRRGFSLIELIIVVAIIGVLAAIAVPRMSRASVGAVDARLVADLAVMRSAIELYAAEHNGTFPTEAKFLEQMTTYTDIAGADNATKTGAYIYGPYLKAIPKLQIGAQKGLSAVADDTAGTTAWTYDETTGNIVANTGALTDAAGVLYTAY